MNKKIFASEAQKKKEWFKFFAFIIADAILFIVKQYFQGEYDKLKSVSIFVNQDALSMYKLLSGFMNVFFWVMVIFTVYYLLVVIGKTRAYIVATDERILGESVSIVLTKSFSVLYKDIEEIKINQGNKNVDTALVVKAKFRSDFIVIFAEDTDAQSMLNYINQKIKETNE